jgi:hypothetical protein
MNNFVKQVVFDLLFREVIRIKIIPIGKETMKN